MTLQQAETRLSELNSEIERLFIEREFVLKEWNAAFNTENQEGIICVDENIGSCHKLYLVNGDFKMIVCGFDECEIQGSISDFYKRIDISMKILNMANHREFKSPDYQKNLVYAKAIEIREKVLKEE